MSNLPNSQNDVLTTVSHALYEFQGLVQAEMPNIPVIYDEELSFETAVKQIIANNSYGNSTPLDLMPFFAYTRTVLIPVQDRNAGGRASKKTACIRVGDDVLQYNMVYGEFDINFLYASNNIEMTEKFEVVYNSEQGITGSKEITVDMAELGQFKYYLEYQDLSEKTIVHDDVYYKGIIGSLKVRGFYFTFKGKSGIIKEINARIISSCDIPNKVENEILGTIIIP